MFLIYLFFYSIYLLIFEKIIYYFYASFSQYSLNFHQLFFSSGTSDKKIKILIFVNFQLLRDFIFFLNNNYYLKFVYKYYSLMVIHQITFIFQEFYQINLQFYFFILLLKIKIL